MSSDSLMEIGRNGGSSSKQIGQWSEPLTSLKISELITFGMSAASTKP